MLRHVALPRDRIELHGASSRPDSWVDNLTSRLPLLVILRLLKHLFPLAPLPLNLLQRLIALRPRLLPPIQRLSCSSLSCSCDLPIHILLPSPAALRPPRLVRRLPRQILRGEFWPRLAALLRLLRAHRVTGVRRRLQDLLRRRVSQQRDKPRFSFADG